MQAGTPRIVMRQDVEARSGKHRAGVATLRTIHVQLSRHNTIQVRVVASLSPSVQSTPIHAAPAGQTDFIMSYNKKDEDDGGMVKVDRTSVFQEGARARPLVGRSLDQH